MLSPYDELPVHQTPYPFTQISSSDYSWDDGYYFGVYSADERVFLYMGMRVSPNSGVIGGYAGVSIDGHQYTARFSRLWDDLHDTVLGPLSFRFTEPFHEIRLALDDNPSGLTFDVRWLGLAPAFEETHHVASNRARRTTDQTRYVQSGTAAGWIDHRGKRYEVEPNRWFASRDHSWGLYDERPPLAPAPSLLPPREVSASARALRFWMPFQTPEYSGFYHFHEDADGCQQGLNDVFGTGFEGVIRRGWDVAPIRLVSVRHDLELYPGTRALRSGSVEVEDEHGGKWRHELESAMPPWFPATIGYSAGSWTDGGSINTYHPAEGTYVESDDFDWSEQPFVYTDHLGRSIPGLHGVEHLVRITSSGPDGVATGLAQVELFLSPAYRRYPA